MRPKVCGSNCFALANYRLPDWLPADIYLRIDPLLGFSAVLAGREWIARALAGVILLALTALIGRFFCAYVCPLGAILDFLDRPLFRRFRRSPMRAESHLRKVKYVALFVCLGAAGIGVSLVHFLDPIALLTRTYTFVFYPAFVGLANLGLDAARPLARALGWMGVANLSYQQPIYYQSLVTLAIFAALEQELVERMFHQGMLKESFPAIRASGQLPHGVPGELYFRETCRGVESFVKRLAAHRTGDPLAPLEADLHIEGLRLTGRIENLYGNGLLQFRYTDVKPKDRLKIWVHHLVVNSLHATNYPLHSILACKDADYRYDPVSESGSRLAELLLIYRQGLTEPIHFFPRSSFAWSAEIVRTIKQHQPGMPVTLSHPGFGVTGFDPLKWSKPAGVDFYSPHLYAGLGGEDATIDFAAVTGATAKIINAGFANFYGEWGVFSSPVPAEVKRSTHRDAIWLSLLAGHPGFLQRTYEFPDEYRWPAKVWRALPRGFSPERAEVEVEIGGQTLGQTPAGADRLKVQ